ncbi:unnamed protein product [Caenorhabditis auriculariae]|uniref:G-protein coupled receptors family 1 profile domain-containing protein n=1 Tax=Caenorhabditis auriculariae TaxID=2777116 RepID=A0A8S1HVC2_9PELO|nr:unnamed protein product [Caenorhabditis auriculariae]
MNIVYVTLTRKEFQGKSGCLQCILSISHIWSLLMELPNSFLLLNAQRVTRRTCYKIIFSYIFSISFQACMWLMLLIDIYIMILLPIWYMKAKTTVYVILMVLPPTIYGTITMLGGFLYMDDEVILFCNPPIG